MHADTLRYFGKIESGVAEPDFPSEAPSVPTAAASLTPEGSHTPSPLGLRKQRSVVDLMLSMGPGYLTRDKSAPGSPASMSPGLPVTSRAPPSIPTHPPPTLNHVVHGPFPSVRVALQEFSRTCRLRDVECFDNESPRFPLLHAVAMQKEQKLAGMKALALLAATQIQGPR